MRESAVLTPEQAFAEMVAQGDVVLDRLDHWVETQPDKVFIDYGEDDLRLGFAAFSRQVDAVAAGLVRLGAVPGDRVSVMTRNSLVAALVMFACWRSGAIYAPVNFNYKGRLLAYQLDDTAPSVFVVGADCAQAVHEVLAETSIAALVAHRPRPGEHDHGSGEFPAGFGAGRRLETFADLLAAGGSVPRLARAFPDLANIVYTSGTTGPAKGVVQSFRWMNQYCYVMRNINGADDVVYCDLPLYHVGGAHFLLARAAWNGNTVGLWDRFSPTDFWRRVARSGCSTGVLLDVMIPWLMSAEPRASDRENTLN